jgi:futalosine hydrolase
MKCLLVAATKTEIAPFLKYYAKSDKTNHIDFTLNVLITGVGQLNACFTLTEYLQHSTPDVILMVGIAGSFTKTLPPGHVVTVKQEYLTDLGVIEKNEWIDMFDLKLVGKNEFPYKNGALINNFTNYLKRTQLPSVRAATVNQISTNKKFIQLITAKYKPQIETMEGAALHFVALQKNIPFVQIRGISNYVGERNKTKWHFKAAIENSNAVLIKMFESL